MKAGSKAPKWDGRRVGLDEVHIPVHLGDSRRRASGRALSDPGQREAQNNGRRCVPEVPSRASLDDDALDDDRR